MEDLSYTPTRPSPMWVDNRGSILVAEHNSPSGRTRHMDREDFACQEWVKRGLLHYKYIHTSVNPADAMSKVVDAILFQRHFNRIQGKNGSIFSTHSNWVANKYDNPSHSSSNT